MQDLATVAVPSLACMQVAAKVHQACAQLQQRLADYEQRPLAGLALVGAQQLLPSRCGVREGQQFGALGLACKVHSSTGGQEFRVTEQQLQPLRVLLIHEYQQAVHEQCRRQCLNQQPGLYGCEGAAQAAAEEHVQLFCEQQLPLVMALLLRHADTISG